MTEPTLSTELADLLAPLEARHDALVAELETVRARERELSDQLRKIEKVKRAAGLSVPVVGAISTNGKPKAKRVTTKVAEWRETAIVDLMSKDPATPMTVPELSSLLGWNSATTNVAVNQARAKGLLRLAGMDGNAKRYRVVA